MDTEVISVVGERARAPSNRGGAPGPTDESRGSTVARSPLLISLNTLTYSVHCLHAQLIGVRPPLV